MMPPVFPFFKLRPEQQPHLVRTQDYIGNSFAPLFAKLVQSTEWVLVREFLNSWIPYQPTVFYEPAYRVDLEGFLSLRGAVAGDASGTAAASLTLPIFVLPPALAPVRTCTFPIVSNDLFGQVRVDNGGRVFVAPPSSTTWASLDSIRYQIRP
jgi:hypothetical protein